MQFQCASPNNANNQAWRFVLALDQTRHLAYYQIRNGSADKCIDVTGSSTANGAALIQNTCTALGSYNSQGWLFTR
jgi:hypothetical protein